MEEVNQMVDALEKQMQAVEKVSKLYNDFIFNEKGLGEEFGLFVAKRMEGEVNGGTD